MMPRKKLILVIVWALLTSSVLALIIVNVSSEPDENLEPIENVGDELANRHGQRSTVASSDEPIAPDGWSASVFQFSDGSSVSVAQPSEYFAINPSRFGDIGPNEYHDLTHFLSFDAALPINEQTSPSANIRIALADPNEEPAAALSNYLLKYEFVSESVSDISSDYLNGQRAEILNNSKEVEIVSSVRVLGEAGAKPVSCIVSLAYTPKLLSERDIAEVVDVYDTIVQFLRRG